ncbi:proteasome subunit alpha type-2-like [Dioscorea cayenensis subsp. rotundata]|uniref:Proteasome subunit alpha type-2-like n=1 Tax=Dioscorea cayennensis subsp. rotundata TaxID=55577 RepID=A0AB40C690_DIOCR|nr:proteasome subunit alpha type-2-like [Dioscorea cayenensis subsp. rotundata]
MAVAERSSHAGMKLGYRDGVLVGGVEAIPVEVVERSSHAGCELITESEVPADTAVELRPHQAWESRRGCGGVGVDPSGSYFSWKVPAKGKNVSNAKAFLEKRYKIGCKANIE